MNDEENEERGFKVTDKRLNFEEEPPNESAPSTKPEEPSAKEPVPSEKTAEETPAQETPGQPLPPIDFSQFIMSLGSSAMIHLGVVPHPADGQMHVDLAGAQQTIDILAVLDEKTRGNLSEKEESLLRNILSDLRIRFVEKSGAK